MLRFPMTLNFEQRGAVYAALSRNARFVRADDTATMLAMALLFLPACMLALALSTRPPTPWELINAACVMGILGGLLWVCLENAAGIATDTLQGMGFDEVDYQPPASGWLDSPFDQLLPGEAVQVSGMLRDHPYYCRLSRHVRIASASLSALLLFFACLMFAHGNLPTWAHWLQCLLVVPPALWIVICQRREQQMEWEAAQRLTSNRFAGAAVPAGA